MSIFNNFSGKRVPFSQTDRGKRKLRVEEGIRQIREDSVLDNQIEIDRRERESKSLFNESISGSLGTYVNSKNSRRRREALHEDLRSSIVKNLFIHEMANIYIESLVMDSQYKDHNREYLYEQALDTYTHLFDSEILTEDSVMNCGNNFIYDVYLECNSILTNLLTEKKMDEVESGDTTPEELETDAKELIDNTNSTERRANIAHEIKDKVTDVIINEKDISEKNKKEIKSLEAKAGKEDDVKDNDDAEESNDDTDKDDIEDEDKSEDDETDEEEDEESKDSEDKSDAEEKGKKSESFSLRTNSNKNNTLFKNIMISNSRELIENNISPTGDRLLETSVLEYTLLETLHSTRLIKFTPELANEVSNSYKYSGMKK